MMTTILVPTPLRRFTGGQSSVSLTAADVGGLIQALEQSYPGVSEKLVDGNGEIKRFINVFVNEDEVRSLQGLATPVGENDRVSIVPAMAGGR
jgi:molybdopterin synthase sulfur carrier subunit